MFFFYMLWTAVILQRLWELRKARQNRKWMLERGAYEVGREHYPYLVAMHVLFFLSGWLEVQWRGGGLGRGWWLFLLLFVAAQALRVWTLHTLGPYWNTRILVLPGARLVRHGPYRWVRHPNYLVVTVEFIALPLIFGAWLTALLFGMANLLLLLKVRIPVEERALSVYRRVR